MKNLPTIPRMQRLFVAVLFLAMGFTFSESVSQVLFFEDFENGSGQWPIPGSMAITTASAYAGSFSQTFTGLASGGDTRTFIFPVTPNQTYYLHVAYMTLGGGGYIGIDRFDASMQFVGEQWMIGDGGWPPTLGKFDYNVFNTDPSNLGIWKVYTQSYTIPGHVNFIRIKTEDWDGGLPNDPLNHGVFFDNIEWSTNSIPSFLPPPVCVNPPSGLVSWWPGDDNANDIKGSNNGTLQNGATFAAGKVGQAFSLDGMNDFINFGSPQVLDDVFDGVHDFTVSSWYVLQDISTYRTLFTKGNVGTGADYSGTLTFTYDPYVGGYTFQIYDNGNGLVKKWSNADFPLNVWLHFTLIYDASLHDAEVYINGQKLTGTYFTTGYDGSVIDNILDKEFKIGGEFISPGNHFWQGLIDEVDVYNRVLSDAEIQSIYNAGSAGKCTNTPPPVCVNPPSDLVSWWPGDDNTNDIQSGNNGTLINDATFAAGLVDEAFSFDGAGDYVSVPDNTAWDFGMNDFTIDLWIRFNQVKNSMFIHQQYDFGGGFEFYYQAGFGALVFNLSGFSNAIGRPWAPQANTWYHLAVTRTSGAFRLYVNGNQLGSEQYNPNPVSDVFGILRIGNYAGGDTDIGGAYDVNGLIDEVEIFNRALSASEIQSIYNANSAGKCKECTPPEVSIAGNESVCPNSTHPYTATTNAMNPSFNWSVTGGTINGDNTGSSISVTAGGAGTMAVSVEVTDGTTNCSNSATLEVSVEDNEPPMIITFPTPISLWPPNHQYETILVAQCVDTVADNCALLSPSDVVVDSVSSDEPEDAKGNGDGNTRNDIVIAANCKSVQLRSERQGGGNGRVYTLYLSVRDGNGNIGTAICVVTVPHSQNGNPAVDNGAAYFVFGNCSSASKRAENFGQMNESETMPEGYALAQNYPNPFNPSTSIAFSVKETGVVQLTIYNLHGQEVRALINGQMNAGFHSVNWDGKDERSQLVPSGVYLYKLRVNGFAQTRKMTFMK